VSSDELYTLIGDVCIFNIRFGRLEIEEPVDIRQQWDRTLLSTTEVSTEGQIRPVFRDVERTDVSHQATSTLRHIREASEERPRIQSPNYDCKKPETDGARVVGPWSTSTRIVIWFGSITRPDPASTQRPLRCCCNYRLLPLLRRCWG